MENYDETYSRTRVRRGDTPEKEKGDWIVRLAVTQITVCALFLSSVFILGKISPDSFLALKEKYISLMKKDMSASEIVSAFRQYSYFAEPVDARESTTEQKTEEGASTSSTETLAAGGEAVALYEAGEAANFAPFYLTAEMLMPVQGEITSPFGYRYHPITGEWSVHNGIDIGADEGTRIKAAFSGKVSEVGSNSVRGNYIVLSHAGGMTTMYMHCSEILAPVGANIRQGETVALVGNTGWSTGPHLHFGICINGKYCNPEWAA